METTEQSEHLTSRRSFLLKGAAVGAGTLGVGRLFADVSPAFASGGLSKGDAAILRFLRGGVLETDLWQQYNELAGIQDSGSPGRFNPAYTAAVAVLDLRHDHDTSTTTPTTISHAAHQRLPEGAREANGQPDKFRTLPSSATAPSRSDG